MASLSASPASPWAADQLTAARTSGTSHGWQMRLNPDPTLAATPTLVDVPAWGITYDLDESRSPFGTMRLRTTPAAAAAYFAPISPLTVKQLFAGYGSTRNLIFAGFPSRRRRVLNATDSYTEIELTTGEDLWDVPLAADYSVPDTYTTIAAVIDDINALLTSTAPGWPLIYSSTSLGSPTSAQLATFRALDFSAGDSYGDCLRNAASALGQKIQGDHLLGYRPTKVYSDQNPAARIVPQWAYAAASAVTITPADYQSYTRDESADDYASLLRLTAQWTSSGDLKSSTYVYSAGAAPSALERVTQRDLTIQMRPELSSGVRKLTATNPVGLAYKNAYARRTWQTTVTMRAWWWVEPGMSLTINGPDGQSDSGVVSRVSFDVDAGLMTVTVRPS